MADVPEFEAAPARPDLLSRLRDDPRVALIIVAVVGVAAVVFVARGTNSAAPLTADAPSVSTTASYSAADESGATTGTGTTNTSTANAAGVTVVVHVVGAVARPDVVTLPAGSRVTDAIDAAGGVGPHADLTRLNLAAVLVDGQQVLVPRRGQTTTGQTTGLGDPTAPIGPNAPVDPAAPININTASAEALEALPGIGPTLAAAIVAERERTGGFAAIEELKRVRGIGDQRFADLRDLVTV